MRNSLNFLLLILLGTSTLRSQPVFVPAGFTLEQDGSLLQQPYAGGLHSGQFFLIDLNNDTVEDLVVFDRAGDVIKVFLYQEGRYTYHPDYAFFFPHNLQNWVYLADYNCDGKDDIFTYSSFGVRVFTNATADGGTPAWELTHDPLFSVSGTSTVNLLVNPSDIPAITDVDADGDLDILAFNFSSGETINFYENHSADDNGGCGLSFVRTTQRWGELSECGCGNYQFGENTCTSPGGRTMHISGKTLLLTDLTGDSLPDLLIGEEDCEELAFLPNTGTLDQARFETVESFFQPSDRPFSGSFFPSAFSGDFNKDGTADLVLSSNHREDLVGLDYTRSAFLLENRAATGASNFSEALPFLQNEMFDVGENAVPVIFDADGDGLPDLLVANKGMPLQDTFVATVTLLRNKGSGLFEVASNDWMQLSQLGLTNLSIQLADVDGGGDADLILKGYGLNTFGLNILWIPNRDGHFNTSEAAPITVAINATDNPFFYDVNGDGKLDILLGQSNGRLSLWVNSGTNTAPEYSTKTDAYLNINLNPDRTFLVPVVVNADGNATPDLLLSDNSGEVRLIADFSSQAEATAIRLYNKTVDIASALSAGRRIWPALADLDEDNVPELVLGTARGGLLIYTGTDERGDPPAITKLQVNAYPNPLQDTRTLKIESNLDATGVLYNVSGQQVGAPVALQRGQVAALALDFLPTGLYFFRILSGQQAVTKKIIVGL